MSKEERRPLIFNVHNFALDDGPGIRTTVFFKGCPLSCVWCHNPESMDSNREIAFYTRLCIQCGDCMEVCSEDAIDLDNIDKVTRGKCTLCGKCAEVCPSTAIRIIGQYYSVNDLVDILLKDRLFYETSHGGVTFSGGEPTMYPDYVSEVMRELKSEGIHIAIQTSGMFNPAEFEEKLLPYIDLIYYDIKIYDSQKHKKQTGLGNDRILDNFVRLLNVSDTAIVPRIPFGPGITAARDNLVRIAEFLKDAGCSRYELLPYNSGGIEKRITLGKIIPAGLANICINPEEERECREIFSRCLLDAAGSDNENLVSRSVK